MNNNLLNHLPCVLLTAPFSNHLRIVGGAVRDSLLCKTIHDIDLACSLMPDKVLNYFESLGISTLKTGLEYGTVTAIINKIPFEITSLRSDIQTNGRHAIVKYTTCWEEDALRRDFTMNALYMDMEGELYDYFEGQADLYQGRVQFIGSADKRIQEDYLRILRFFRFHSYYGEGQYDESGLNACIARREGLNILSKERITSEFLKILASPQSTLTMETLFQTKILDYILPISQFSSDWLKNLYQIEQEKELTPCPFRRLCLLLILNIKKPDFINHFLKIPKKSYSIIENTMSFFHVLKEKSYFPLLESPTDQSNFQNALLLLKSFEVISNEEWGELWEKSNQPLKTFPLTGQDLLEAGYIKGETIGKILKTGKEFWHEGGQIALKNEILSYLRISFP